MISSDANISPNPASPLVKVMVPKHSLETLRPELPRYEYSMLAILSVLNTLSER